MKLTRKLVPAFAMLLVSAIMLTTASFAWFSTNDDVSATGMSVKATTAENLVIATTAVGATFGTSATLQDVATDALKPVSIHCGEGDVIGTNASFYAVKETSLSTIDYASGAYAEDTLFEAVTAEGYYETFTVQVKVDGEDGAEFDKIYVENITVTRAGGTNPATLNISKAIRVAVTDGTTTYIYAPLAEAGPNNLTYNSITSIDGSGKATADAQVLGTYTDASDFGPVDTDVKEFTIYVWYEGQDPNCISANAVSVEDLAVSVFFKAENNPVTPGE